MSPVVPTRCETTGPGSRCRAGGTTIRKLLTFSSLIRLRWVKFSGCVRAEGLAVVPRDGDDRLVQQAARGQRVEQFADGRVGVVQRVAVAREAVLPGEWAAVAVGDAIGVMRGRGQVVQEERTRRRAAVGVEPAVDQPDREFLPRAPGG